MLATQATAFSTGHFQVINMPENVEVSCLFYPSLVLSVRYNVYGEKRPVTPSEYYGITVKGKRNANTKTPSAKNVSVIPI